MKTLFLSGAILFLLSIMSCEKDNIVPKPTMESAKLQASNSSDANLNQRASGMRMYFDNGKVPGVDGIDYGCSGSGGNCYPDVTVSPSLAEMCNDFGVSSNPSSFAEDHYSELSNVVDQDILDAVINETYSVHLRCEGSTTSTGYLLFKDANEDIQAVCVYRAQ